MPKKSDIIKSFLPPMVSDIITVQIDLDSTQLGISDVLRNLNRAYPPETRERKNIRDGRLVIGVLCKSELIDPYRGIFFIIGNQSIKVHGSSRNYIMFTVDEERMRTLDGISSMSEDIGIYLAKTISKEVKDFPLFYQKFVYDEYEMEKYKDDDIFD